MKPCGKSSLMPGAAADPCARSCRCTQTSVWERGGARSSRCVYVWCCCTNALGVGSFFAQMGALLAPSAPVGVLLNPLHQWMWLLSLQGVLQSPCAWYNLSRQGLQPSLHVRPTLPPGSLSIDMDVEVPGAASPAAAHASPSWGSWFWDGLLGRALAAVLGRLSQLLRTLGRALLARGPQALRDLWRLLCDSLLRPVARFGRPASRRPLRAVPTLQAAYSGGSCVRIEGEVHGCQRVSLFNLSIPMPAAGLEVGFAAASCCEVQPVLALTLASGEAAADAKQARASLASTVLLLPSKSVGDSTLGWLGTGAAGSASLVHTQAPLEAVGPVWDGQQPQQEGAVEVRRSQALPWVRRRYRLVPGQLPLAPGQLITGVHLLLLPPEGKDRCEARIYLGEFGSCKACGAGHEFGGRTEVRAAAAAL